MIACRILVSAQRQTYPIPDICVVSFSYRREPVLTQPPHLAIEIVPREDEPAGLLVKVADYLRFGIPHMWIPDPYKRPLQEANREGIRDSPSLVVETDLVGKVDFNELFAQLDGLPSSAGPHCATEPRTSALTATKHYGAATVIKTVPTPYGAGDWYITPELAVPCSRT